MSPLNEILIELITRLNYFRSVDLTEIALTLMYVTLHVLLKRPLFLTDRNNDFRNRQSPPVIDRSKLIYFQDQRATIRH